MAKLQVDYNRCLWHAIMRTLDLDVQGLARTLDVGRQSVHRWIGGRGRGRGPRPDRYLEIVQLLTGGRAGRRGFAGAYDVLAAETGQQSPNLRRWAGAPEPMQEGNRLAAMGIWHRLGYPIKSYRDVDFDRRLVEVHRRQRTPESRWIEGLGYLPPNPFELWPWPDPHGGEVSEEQRPSMAMFRAQKNRRSEEDRRRTGR